MKKIMVLIFTVVMTFSFSVSIEDIKEDLDVLKEVMSNEHADFFADYEKEKFYQDVEELKNNLKNMDIYEVIFSIQEILAKANDGHTEVSGLFNNNDFYPYELAYYDSIYTRALPKKYEKYLGWKVKSINFIKIDKVIDIIDRISNEDNVYGLKKNFENIINKAQALKYLGITSSNQVLLSLEKNGEKANIIVKLSDKNKIYLGRAGWVNDGKRVDEPFWLGEFISLEEKNGLYIQYNECYSKEVYEKMKTLKGFESLAEKNLDKYPSVEKTFRDFFKDKEDKYDFAVIDLRNNSGGSVLPTMYMIIELMSQPQLIGTNFYVLTDRTTFSSGVLSTYMFDKFLNATVVGEPPSGKPNHPTEAKKTSLPNTNITVRYPINKGEFVDMEGNVYVMDHLIEPTFEEYMGKDVMMYKILELEGIMK
ncbi:MAG: hypothetical protein ACQESN_05800 [Thermotogota bacterium]